MDHKLILDFVVVSKQNSPDSGSYALMHDLDFWVIIQHLSKVLGLRMKNSLFANSGTFKEMFSINVHLSNKPKVNFNIK